MEEVGRITQIWRYPVKSMAGERLESVHVGVRGLPGDRAWAVRDEVRGTIGNGKKIPRLMRCAARYLDEPVAEGSSPAVIELEDGSRLETGDADVAARLSAALECRVTLWPLLPATAREHYRRAAPEPDHDAEGELRAALGRTSEEPLPDLSRLPREVLEFATPPGTYFDAYPILLLSQASLDQMQAAAPESKIDVRRFRPNFLVETTAGAAETVGFPETAWAGRRVRLGSALLDAHVACLRCVMTTVGFADLPQDPRIMRALVREAEGNLGVYASVLEPGAVEVGDAVVLED